MNKLFSNFPVLEIKRKTTSLASAKRKMIAQNSTHCFQCSDPFEFCN